MAFYAKHVPSIYSVCK